MISGADRVGECAVNIRSGHKDNCFFCSLPHNSLDLKATYGCFPSVLVVSHNRTAAPVPITHFSLFSGNSADFTVHPPYVRLKIRTVHLLRLLIT